MVLNDFQEIVAGSFLPAWPCFRIMKCTLGGVAFLCPAIESVTGLAVPASATWALIAERVWDASGGGDGAVVDVISWDLRSAPAWISLSKRLRLKTFCFQ